MNNHASIPTPPTTPDGLLRRAISTYGLSRLLTGKASEKAGSDAPFKFLWTSEPQEVHLVNEASMRALGELAPEHFLGAQLSTSVLWSDVQLLRPYLPGRFRGWLVATPDPRETKSEALIHAIRQHSLAQGTVKGAFYRRAAGAPASMWHCSAATSAFMLDKWGSGEQEVELCLAPHPAAPDTHQPAQGELPITALAAWPQQARDIPGGLQLRLADAEYLHQWHEALRRHSEGAVLAASLHWTPESLGCDWVGKNLSLDAQGSGLAMIKQLLTLPEGRSEFEVRPGLSVTATRRDQGLTVAIEDGATFPKSHQNYVHEDRRVLHGLLLAQQDRELGMKVPDHNFGQVVNPSPQIWAGLLERAQLQNWAPPLS